MDPAPHPSVVHERAVGAIIENRGNVAIHVTEIKDNTSDGFEYVLGSTTSSSNIPPQFTAGEHTTNILKNEILWIFGGIGKELATSTT